MLNTSKMHTVPLLLCVWMNGVLILETMVGESEKITLDSHMSMALITFPLERHVILDAHMVSIII